MRIDELKEKLKGVYNYSEVYRYHENAVKKIYTDNIFSVDFDGNTDHYKVQEFRIMDRKEYDNTILAGSLINSKNFDKKIFPVLVVIAE
ncbi:MAG TPA: hypothetical protein DCS12_05695 [Clostridiales bacterium]|jgi:hypothetical protein|nr:hypothetical protein [Clostridiales bacterium]